MSGVGARVTTRWPPQANATSPQHLPGYLTLTSRSRSLQIDGRRAGGAALALPPPGDEPPPPVAAHAFPSLAKPFPDEPASAEPGPSV
eukprot:CAMPEP_0196691856 /NCGR_PEP_ID=MMETSP1090-20130531/25467_1 /TAXON_ID=37098 /ORGANISM="Isochrysis sp, Strain CCMP1244" /LENGTH=87 /DNA_ID=CAMNT_0042031149 /DNA_START=32 /DNA_END=290 /DNA_ORIENTATION=+